MNDLREVTEAADEFRDAVRPIERTRWAVSLWFDSAHHDQPDVSVALWADNAVHAVFDACGEERWPELSRIQVQRARDD